MNKYQIIITLATGDRVEAKSVGDTEEEAIARLEAAEQFQDFIKNTPIKDLQITLLGTAAPINPDNYILQESNERPGYYVVTDKVNNVVIIFAKGRFNDTAKITPIFDLPREPMDAATILREIGEYLTIYHKEVL